MGTLTIINLEDPRYEMMEDGLSLGLVMIGFKSASSEDTSADISIPGRNRRHNRVVTLKYSPNDTFACVLLFK
jgi:hypothetical protein